MAQIVLGVGTSHGPLLSTPPEQWSQRAEADRRNPHLCYRGRFYRFDELLEARAGEDLAREGTLEKRKEHYAACQRALDVLGQTLAQVVPDVAVIVGDDQEELITDEVMPAFMVYWGDKIHQAPPSPE